jgi:hypothetical protein
MMFQPIATAKTYQAGTHCAGGRHISTAGERQVGQGESKVRLITVLQKGIIRAYKTIKSRGRYTVSPRSIYPILLFLAEVAAAAHGYLIWPSITRSTYGKVEDEWFMNLDL